VILPYLGSRSYRSKRQSHFPQVIITKYGCFRLFWPKKFSVTVFLSLFLGTACLLCATAGTCIIEANCTLPKQSYNKENKTMCVLIAMFVCKHHRDTTTSAWKKWFSRVSVADENRPGTSCQCAVDIRWTGWRLELLCLVVATSWYARSSEARCREHQLPAPVVGWDRSRVPGCYRSSTTDGLQRLVRVAAIRRRRLKLQRQAMSFLNGKLDWQLNTAYLLCVSNAVSNHIQGGTGLSVTMV